MQESIARPIVVAIREGAIVEAVVVDPVRDALHGSGPCQCGDVLSSRGGHVGGPGLRPQFGGTVSIYGQRDRGED